MIKCIKKSIKCNINIALDKEHFAPKVLIFFLFLKKQQQKKHVVAAQ